MTQLGFYIDTNSCSGCRCCQVACKDRNDLPVGVFFRKVSDYEGGVFPNTWAASLSLACNHCECPQCAKNCPVAAITKCEDTGLVIQDREMCIGCGKCVLACPYGAPAYDPLRDVMEKCDGCLAMVEEGKLPACVATCSTRCLRFGDIEELAEIFADERLTKDLSFLSDSSITNPSILILPKAEMVS